MQRPLFQDRSASNVIPFETYAPAPMDTRPSKASPARPAVKAQPRRSKPRDSEAQANLDFLPSVPEQPRTLGTSVEAVIICEAPVATPLHRAIAALLDWSIVFIGYGLFLLAFSMAGGEFVLTRANLLVFAAALPVLAFAYGLFWAVARTETAGMRWARLRLVTFEGFPLEPNQYLLRFAGSCLSLCTLLGLLWSLADEESLTWQDHISRTFPTPLASESQLFVRN
ncbi:MAG: RDD family protein [Acidobacteriia bacterium]|nr:RDD family protein [Terriglobia bacterium]